jgi:hypothetical protein
LGGVRFPGLLAIPILLDHHHRVSQDGVQGIRVRFRDPLLDIAKTDYYAIKAHAAKREGFLAGYGRLPVHWHDRVQLYKLYHALELWDWFAALGNTAAVLRITEDLQRFSAV